MAISAIARRGSYFQRGCNHAKVGDEDSFQRSTLVVACLRGYSIRKIMA
jgi:hypothetical protein